MRCFLIIYCTITFVIFFLKPDISQAIITPRDEDIIYKRDTEQIFSQPWENGLKEATYRVFIKEGWLEPGLKNELHVAPILGDNVPTVPFGDISMLARGQLYHNHGNLIFVRDKNLYDCENCRIQIPRKKYGDILTLWSVKRIRHRRSEDNFR
nr:uncharacterized protein LOC111417130 [Onthophagus taurus]